MELHPQMTKFMERVEDKIDEIRDSIHQISLTASETQVRQQAHKEEIDTLKREVDQLKTAYHKASGAWKLLTLPGGLSFLYVLTQFFKT